jgi:glycine/D-amino acid oxidase-like deaminating enzyme
LADLGYTVVVIEERPFLGGGTSTKNEGWLHAGTFHATSIANPNEAAEVARRCIYGFERISRYSPEVLDSRGVGFAIVPEDLYEHALSRWEMCGVQFTPATPTQVESLKTSVRLASGESVFVVRDVGINTRMLISRYAQDLRRNGVPIYLATTPLSWTADGQLVLRQQASLTQLRCKQLVTTTGYGTEQLLRTLKLPALQLRYWKSHLCITPRLSESAVFSIANKQAAMMTHDDMSVTGLNQDAVIIDKPSFEPTAEGISELRTALAERFVNLPSGADMRFTACTKIDFAAAPDHARSLNIHVSHISDRVTVALPGKMTESPYVADHVAREIFDMIDSSIAVARRPLEAVI